MCVYEKYIPPPLSLSLSVTLPDTLTCLAASPHPLPHPERANLSRTRAEGQSVCGASNPVGNLILSKSVILMQYATEPWLPSHPGIIIVQYVGAPSVLVSGLPI